MSDYTHNKGYSAGENGYAVGVAGSETQIIDSVGNITLPTGKMFTGNQKETLTAVVGTTTSTRAGGAAITNYGITTINSTSGQKNYTLAAPVAGVHKTIACTAGSTDNTCVVLAATGVTFDGTNVQATFNAANDFLDLVGLSATQWLIKTNGGSVALATT